MSVIVKQFERHDALYYLSTTVLIVLLISIAATLPLIIQDLFLKWKMNKIDADEILFANTNKNENENLPNTLGKFADSNEEDSQNAVKRMINNKTLIHVTSISHNHKLLPPSNNRLLPKKCICHELNSNDDEDKAKILKRREIQKELLEEKENKKGETTHSLRFDWLFKKPQTTEKSRRNPSRKTTEKSIIDFFRRPETLTATMNDDYDNKTNILSNFANENVESPIVTVIMKKETPIIVGETEKEDGRDLFDVFEKGMGILESLFPFITEKSDTNQQITENAGEDPVDNAVYDGIFPRFFYPPMVRGFLGGIVDETRDRFEKKIRNLWDRDEGSSLEFEQMF